MVIQEVGEDLVESAKAFLSNREEFGFFNKWEGLFNYAWKLEAFPYGYAVLDGERIVAFIGTIFSERIVDGRKRICCNMTTWLVEEAYRPRMLARLLLNPIFKMADVLITSLSP